jgi:hypothetical protein
MDERNLILHVLLAPQTAGALSPRLWDVLVRQGRRANLLARLAGVLDDGGWMGQVPPAPRQHLLSAQRVVQRQAIAVRWEVECIQDALADVGVPVTLIKGAAYLMAGLPAAQGRIFSDVDILVPKSAMAEVESALMLKGWRSHDTTAYDQRYYRRWMHEIPPMTHIRRGTTIDVHHAILPETARLKVNTPALFEAIQPLPDHPGLAVLAPIDMLLHSATHLFHEGEFENGLRDLFDLDLLLAHCAKTPGFWETVVPRAQTLGLCRPLHYALRYAALWLRTPIPGEVLQAAQAAAGLPAWRQRLMDGCFSRALRPMHPSSDDRWSAPAKAALYVRSHWIRMPLHLLAYHLARKAVVRPPVPEPPATPAEETKQGPEQAPRL